MRHDRTWWLATVARWERSGLTQVEFARREGINVNSLRWWVRQAREQRSDGFVEVVPATRPAKTGGFRDGSRSNVAVSVELEGGVVLRFADLPPAAWLAELVSRC